MHCLIIYIIHLQFPQQFIYSNSKIWEKFRIRDQKPTYSKLNIERRQCMILTQGIRTNPLTFCASLMLALIDFSHLKPKILYETQQSQDCEIRIQPVNIVYGVSSYET